MTPLDRLAAHQSVAEHLAANTLAGRAFASVSRLAVSDLFRSALGHPEARLGSRDADAIERHLGQVGVIVQPSIRDLDAVDSTRLYRTNTVAADLMNNIVHPTIDGDRHLAHAVTKIRGRWEDGTRP